MKVPIALLFLLFLGLVSAQAATSDELIDQIKAAVREETKTTSEGNDASAQQRLYATQQLLAQLTRNAAEDSSERGLVAAVEAVGLQAKSDKLAELCRTLAHQLRAESQEREAALAQKMEKELSQALRIALAAKTAKEMDAPMETVRGLMKDAGSRQTANAKLRTLIETGQQLSEFLRQWQDHLAGVDDGNSGNSRQRLQSLVGSGRDFSTLMPRSEILARFAELQKNVKPTDQDPMPVGEFAARAREIIQATKRLEDLAGAIEKFEALTRLKRIHGSETEAFMQAYQSLRTYQRIYAELTSGLATQIQLSSITGQFSNTASEAVFDLRNQLLLFAIPRILGIPEAPAAQEGDNLTTYFQRIAIGAREKSDWVLLGRTLELSQTLNAGPFGTSDRSALTSFLAGLNQERAKQYAPAVVSFQSALKTGSQLISADLIGQHLERIRKEQPQEFERGIQITLNPPSSSYDPRFPRPGYPFGSPTPADVQAPTSITVPAVPTKPAATPPAASSAK